MIYNYIEITQPIGTFYICSIPAVILLNIVDSKSRNKTDDGVQRERDGSRTEAIGKYCSDPDAVFPTPIVISVSEFANLQIDTESHKIDIPDDEYLGEVIDGQHRLWGIEKANNPEVFDLPVVLMFNLSLGAKAYVFSTINSNQKQVNPSLIADLFELSDYRSPFKTAHQIARAMNFDKTSPFYNRLKMLGKKEWYQDNATLSQGTFVKCLVRLISKNPAEDSRLIKLNCELINDDSLPFRSYFIQDQDFIITKIIYNCFSALKEVFREEWESPQSNILWKTTGFGAIMDAMPELYILGSRQKQLNIEFFTNCFSRFKAYLNSNQILLTSDNFPGGGEQQKKRLSNLLQVSIHTT